MRRRSDVVRKTKLYQQKAGKRTGRQIGVTFSDKAEVQGCLRPGSQSRLGRRTMQTADNTTAGSERHKQKQHGINRGKGASNLAGI